jgi:molybdate/tungstate transport system ATP-binding protein
VYAASWQGGKTLIELKKLGLDFRTFSIRDIDLHIQKNEYFILVGPTGAGKTLLLETIAGLHPVNRGEIWLDKVNVTGLQPEKRRISLVYQDSALFPHLSVAENIVFGLRIRKTDKKDILNSLDEIAAAVGVTHLLKRKPRSLSGGEKQKIALARALIIKPELLLLDEPLTSLDQETRDVIREELKTLHRSFGATTIHVTHDFEEAVSMGDRVAVLGEGRIRQVGTPEEVFRKPNSAFVAHFTMAQNIFPGEVQKTRGQTQFKTGNLEFLVSDSFTPGKCTAVLRPEDITISTGERKSLEANVFTGTVNHIVDRGATLVITVDLSTKIVCLLTRRQFADLGPSTGQKVSLHFNPEAVHIFYD